MSKSKPTTKPNASPDDRVTNLPGLGKVDGVQFAGYASVRGETGSNGADAADESLFYWFVGTDDYAKRPTILWTNGGPGSSSFWGFFLENGPYEIDSTGTKLTERPKAWNNYANYMIFEHPLSVTLSFANDTNDVPKTVEQGIAQLYQALLNFIAKHPEIAKNPLIVAGESYAGTYLPLLSKAILEGNQSGRTQFDLRVMVLLDSWVNPMVQMATDTTYAATFGLITPAQKKLFDENTSPEYLPQINDAIQAISGCYMANIAQAADPSFDPIYAYLNHPKVREALHVDNSTPLTKNWSLQVWNNYAPHVNDSYAGVVQELLDGGPNGGNNENRTLPLLNGNTLKVQVISGMNDAKDCNFIGTGAWLELLHGNAALAFKAAFPKRWQDAQGNIIGFAQDGGLLSWLKVLNAGHMAAMDQPSLIQYILKALD